MPVSGVDIVGDLKRPVVLVVLAAKRRADHVRYLEWQDRQLALAERERRMRWRLLGFGAVVGLGLLVAIAGVVLWLWHAVTTATVHINGAWSSGCWSCSRPAPRLGTAA